MTSTRAAADSPDRKPSTGALRLWLMLVALLVAATAIVGAATRLTGSGLSITEWRPIMGVVPPLSDADWQEAFAKYQAIPQYQRVNRGMSLDAFRTIYWWEWSHRMIARSIGVVFLLPLLILALRGAIPGRLAPRLGLILALGLLQGAVGWYMVRSGLVDRVDVSQYRLALHLALAFLIIGLIVWTILDLSPARARAYLSTLTAGQRRMAAVLAGLVFLQVIAGALVAGLKAGLTFNTWPLMDGGLVPAGLWTLTPWWANLFENAALVQLDHRLLAYILAVLGTWHAVSLARSADDERVSRSAVLLAALIVGQSALGIWTLIAWVPVGLGVAHQAGATALFCAAVWHLHAVRRAGHG